MKEAKRPDWPPATAQRVERTPDAGAAAAGWERLWAAAPAEVRGRLRADAGLQQAVLQLLASSEFLAEGLIQAPELVLWLAAERPAMRPREAWGMALAEFTASLPEAERAAGLMRYKRREYLRIALRDLEGQAALAETTQELSYLADAVLQQAFVWAWNEAVQRFGTPRQGDGAGAEMAVLGLGKLGGEELNYSSDIDLMFVYSGAGETAGGGQSTSNHEFFARLAQRVTGYVSAVTPEGPAYRVDLRLRPGGREGEVALPLRQMVAYYHGQARDWELQMLIRARPCAGSRRLAEQLLQAVQARVYPQPAAAEALAEGVRGARQRMSEQLGRHRASGRRGAGVDLKLEAGGIRDIEFLAQYLQRLHGGAEPWVRGGNTLIAVQRLHDKGWLTGSEFQQLSSAYRLLRQLEHRLQLRLGQQSHALPQQAGRLAALARSLRQADGAPSLSGSGAELAALVGERMQAVRTLCERTLGRQEGAAPEAPRAPTAAGPPSHGQRQWQRLLRSAATAPAAEAALRELSPAARARLELALEQSDWMGEALIRRPRLAAALEPDYVPALTPAETFAAGMGALRRHHQEQSLRLLLEEWEKQAPIAASLRAHSALAQRLVQQGLEWARPAAPPAPTLAVLALGRLGLGELDLLSDLDLVFVAAESEREAASRLAAKLIEILTAYTQHGSLYAVDTRLRPRGRDGELVQTSASLSAYFREAAGLWEAVSYRKARWIAGDAACGGAALGAVQTALGLRYRQTDAEAMRAELARLRQRMEQEGRPGRWGLKTIAGGYYDVDFVVARRMVQQVGLDPLPQGLAGWAQALPAEELPAAVSAELGQLTGLLRAADHALRVATGKAGAAVPAGGEAVERGWRWLRRILPAGAEAGAEAVDRARVRVREIYQKWH